MRGHNLRCLYGGRVRDHRPHFLKAKVKMSTPTTAITRLEFSYSFEEFNLAASRAGFVVPKIFRPRVMGQKSGKFERIKVDQLLRKRMDISRAPDSTYKQDSHRFGLDDFATQEYGIESPLSDRTVKMYRDIHDAEGVTVDRLIDTVLREYEMQGVEVIQGGDYWPTEGEDDLATDLSTAWSDTSNSTPITDVETARQTIVDRTGIYPNCLLVNRKQFFYLQNNVSLINRVIYNEKVTEETMNPQMIAKLLGLKYVVVSDAVQQNTASPELEAVLEPVWSNEYALLCRIAEGNDTAEPCVGRTFMWSEENTANPFNDRELAVILEEYRAENVRASVLRARADWQIKVLYPETAQLFRNVIAS